MLGLAAPVAFVTLPRAGDNVLVIAWPGLTAYTVVAEAGGALVSVGASGQTAVAGPGDAGFTARLYGAGAVLVLDAAAVGGCLGRLRQMSQQVLS